ncbi:hypothetical protein FB480_103509 [Agrobacterium vitis]|nr:hypothetical protein FB480_103509 [Agrobacterium vitis]
MIPACHFQVALKNAKTLLTPKQVKTSHNAAMTGLW